MATSTYVVRQRGIMTISLLHVLLAHFLVAKAYSRRPRDVHVPFQVNGGWGAWGSWICNATCNQTGVEIRRRLCQIPSSNKSGNECLGRNMDVSSILCVKKETECTEDCREGFWGDDCGILCPPNCLGDCHKERGFCLYDCKTGWLFDPRFTCSEACPDFTYGKNCTGDCFDKCQGQDCINRSNGQCPGSNPQIILLLVLLTLFALLSVGVYFGTRKNKKSNWLERYIQDYNQSEDYDTVSEDSSLERKPSTSLHSALKESKDAHGSKRKSVTFDPAVKGKKKSIFESLKMMATSKKKQSQSSDASSTSSSGSDDEDDDDSDDSS